MAQTGWCGSCGTPHPIGFRFCAACGQALDSGVPSGAQIGTPRPKGRRQNTVVLVIVAVVVAIGLLSWLGSVTKAPAAPPVAAQSIAYKLAVIQSGHSLDRSDPLVEEMQMALDNLRPQCKESPVRLAAEAVVTHQGLEKHGIGDSYLTILRATHNSIPRRFGRTECRDVMALWEVLRERSSS